MADNILWNCLEELPVQEAALKEWQSILMGWHSFNTSYTHFLRVEYRRVKQLSCPSPCEQGYPRQVVENFPSDIKTVCPQNQADPIQLKFRDILIYSIRQEALHQALCTSLKIKYSEDRRKEHEHVWHLGEYSGTEVYITYRTAILSDSISLLYLSQQAPFILMVPTMNNITPEIQLFMVKNNSILFSMADELRLHPDGSFRVKRTIQECMKSFLSTDDIPRARD